MTKFIRLINKTRKAPLQGSLSLFHKKLRRQEKAAQRRSIKSLFPRHLNGRSRERKITPVFVHHIHDLQIQAVFGLQKVGQRRFGNVHAAAQVNAVRIERIHRHGHFVRDHLGVILQKRRQVAAQRFQRFTRGAVGHANGKIPQTALALVAVADVLRRDLGIFNRNNDIIQRTELCGAERDILDRAL